MSYRSSRSFDRVSVEQRALQLAAAVSAALPAIERGLISAQRIHRSYTPEAKALRLFEDLFCVGAGLLLARLLGI